MYVCILNQDGEILLHRPMKASPEPFLKAIAPYREEMVVAVECIFNGNQVSPRARTLTLPGEKGGKTAKNPLLEGVCLLTRYCWRSQTQARDRGGRRL